MMDRVLGVVGRTQRRRRRKEEAARRMVATVGAAERKNGKRERGREDVGPLVTSASHDTIGGREGGEDSQQNQSQ